MTFENLFLRKADKGDMKDVLRWRNDPVTLKFCFIPYEVDEANHNEWFSRAITSSRKALWIAELPRRKIGIVRFDKGGAKDWVISINLNPDERGKGYSVPFIHQAIALHRITVGRCRIDALIKPDNVVSQHVFYVCNFRKVRTLDSSITMTDDVTSWWEQRTQDTGEVPEIVELAKIERGFS